jgi:hypothetical protein
MFFFIKLSHIKVCFVVVAGVFGLDEILRVEDDVLFLGLWAQKFQRFFLHVVIDH